MKKPALHFSYHLLLLYALPTVFIIAYVWLYFNPTITIYQHLSAITLAVLTITSVKLLINHYFNNKRLILFVGTVLYSSFIFSLILYYSLVFVGLQSWSKVITKEFIVAYAAQANFFLESLGVSYHLVIVALVTAYSFIAVACYYFLRKFHWLPARHPNSTWLIGPFIFCLCVLFSVYSYLYVTEADSSSREPLKLTFLSGQPNQQQSHDAKLGSKPDQQLDLIEDNARRNYQATASGKKHNLIVIVVDGLRPDHTSAYGYFRDTTPYLKELSRQPSYHQFSNVRSVCAETTCAHAGFMASRFIKHLPDNLFTLQEALKLNGYRTNFIISGDHINFYNIRQVYGDVDSYYDGSMAKGYYFNDDTITTNKTKTLPEWDGKPTMIHYHLLSAHLMGKRFPQYRKFSPYKSYSVLSNDGAKPEYGSYYDNGVLQTDAVINELLETLKQKKYLDDALVVITADHGEALGEHNFFTHTNSVIEETLKVPFIMVSYGYQSTLPSRDDSFMSLIDLAPTILTELGLNIPDSWAGIPVQLKKDRPYSYFEMTPFKGLYDHRDKKNLWKYWRNLNSGEEFVYNITQDPHENTNLVWKTSSGLLNEWRTAAGSIAAPGQINQPAQQKPSAQ